MLKVWILNYKKKWVLSEIFLKWREMYDLKNKTNYKPFTNGRGNGENTLKSIKNKIN